MRRSRATVKVITLFILLFTLTASPIAIMSIQNRAVMEKVSRVPVREEGSLNISLSIEKKLEIINTTMINKNPVMVNEAEENSDLIIETKKQLSKLSELNVIPSLDYFADCKANSYKMLFIDLDDPRNIVTVKEYNLDYNDFTVNLWIDVDTFVIYNFAIYSRELELYDNLKIFSPRKFINYLGLNEEDVWIDGDEYYGLVIANLDTTEVQLEYFFDPEGVEIAFNY